VSVPSTDRRSGAWDLRRGHGQRIVIQSLAAVRSKVDPRATPRPRGRPAGGARAERTYPAGRDGVESKCDPGPAGIPARHPGRRGRPRRGLTRRVVTEHGRASSAGSPPPLAIERERDEAINPIACKTSWRGARGGPPARWASVATWGPARDDVEQAMLGRRERLLPLTSVPPMSGPSPIRWRSSVRSRLVRPWSCPVWRRGIVRSQPTLPSWRVPASSTCRSTTPATDLTACGARETAILMIIGQPALFPTRWPLRADADATPPDSRRAPPRTLWAGGEFRDPLAEGADVADRIDADLPPPRPTLLQGATSPRHRPDV
jgi:hypothetical protein